MVKKQKHKISENSPISLISLTNKSSPVSEQYRTIRTNIQFSSSADDPIKTLVITSSGPGEGKSTCAANIALVFAQAGQRTLLVDADMRKPTVFRTFNLTNEKGLSTILSTPKTLSEVVQQTEIEHLSIVTSGPMPPNPSEILSSNRMTQVIKEMRGQFDIVIFDTPPIVAVTDAQILSSSADGTLLVVRENVSKKEDLLKAKDLLDFVQARVLGAIYNGAENNKDQAYQYYYTTEK
ncbi:MAG: CpsD/CapB family tyrosine-protein kinase [Streptococcaceae bacterium]|jgi:capsular exopolysaccharide synthesis family protein|nr:CpsD/CapB family tyrosine-protein kinase [Streptococcaceae bacterium]